MLSKGHAKTALTKAEMYTCVRCLCKFVLCSALHLRYATEVSYGLDL